MTRVKTWVKISKVMPQPKSISPGEGREALQQVIQVFQLQMSYGLTIHIRFKFTTKFFISVLYFGKIQAN